jgi:hypothetical protein
MMAVLGVLDCETPSSLRPGTFDGSPQPQPWLSEHDKQLVHFGVLFAELQLSQRQARDGRRQVPAVQPENEQVVARW